MIIKSNWMGFSNNCSSRTIY